MKDNQMMYWKTYPNRKFTVIVVAQTEKRLMRGDSVRPVGQMRFVGIKMPQNHIVKSTLRAKMNVWDVQHKFVRLKIRYVLTMLASVVAAAGHII